MCAQLARQPRGGAGHGLPCDGRTRRRSVTTVACRTRGVMSRERRDRGRPAATAAAAGEKVAASGRPAHRLPRQPTLQAAPATKQKKNTRCSAARLLLPQRGRAAPTKNETRGGRSESPLTAAPTPARSRPRHAPPSAEGGRPRSPPTRNAQQQAAAGTTTQSPYSRRRPVRPALPARPTPPSLSPPISAAGAAPAHCSPRHQPHVHADAHRDGRLPADAETTRRPSVVPLPARPRARAPIHRPTPKPTAPPVSSRLVCHP